MNWLRTKQRAPGAPADAVQSLSQVLHGRQCQQASHVVKNLLHPFQKYRLKLEDVNLKFLSS